MAETRSTVLVTGASGTVGRELVLALRRLDVQVREARSSLDPSSAADRCKFAYEEPETWGPALDNVDRVFLMRPPAISNIKGVIAPFIRYMSLAPIRQVVVLSVMGVNPAMPHWQLEREVRASGLPWTMLRPAFFMQNLQTAYLESIRDHDRIRLPAGNGRTSFVDTRDVAEVAAQSLFDPDYRGGKAFTLTGGEALSWTQVAAALSAELDRSITYQKIGLLQARKELIAANLPQAYVNIQLLINIVAKVGLAAKITETIPQLLDRPAGNLASYLHSHRENWVNLPTT